MTGPRHSESYAERRARGAAVDDPAVVLDAALRFLEARQRSVSEVRRRLNEAGYREDLIAGALARLGDLGMLDDQAFAGAWVESRDRARPRGERALRMELRQKGIDAETISQAIADRHGPVGEENAAEPSPDEVAARRLLARHAAALARVTDPRARRQRAYALLARNGFGPEIAGDLARESSTEPLGDPADPLGDPGDPLGDPAGPLGDPADPLGDPGDPTGP